jgi:Skp family chaperone for outer membrane proteins
MKASRFGKTIFLLCAVAAVAMLSGGAAVAQDSGSGDGEITVGTYDMRAIFQAYDGRQEFMQRAQEIQQQAQAAQQAGDRQKLQQLQQQMQQEQQKMGMKLTEAIDGIIANVAEEQGLEVVVSEVLYSVDAVETKDVTDAIIKEVNEASGGASGGESQGAPTE